MAMKYPGSFSLLKKLLAYHQIVGSWEAEPNGVYMLRCADGANLHWARGSKSLWIDGKVGPRRALEAYLAQVLSEQEIEWQGCARGERIHVAHSWG